MKVIRIPLAAMRNEESFQFYMDFRTLAIEKGIDKENIDTLFVVFVGLLDQFTDVLEQIRKSGHTELLDQLDQSRDDLHRGITQYISALTYHFNPTLVAAAKRMKAITDHYGNVRDLSFNEETGTLTNLVHDLRQHSDDLQLLQLTEWVAKIEKANLDFHAKMSERYSETAVLQNMENVQTIRIKLADVYRKMVQKLEALVVVMPDEAIYPQFINEWNARVGYYKHTLAMRKGKRKSEEK